MAAVVAAAPATAEVARSTDSGFLVRHRAAVHAAPDVAWRTLVERVGLWWHPDHTWFGDSTKLSIDPRPGGCFCESGPDGAGVQHLEVVFLQPQRLLRMRGALGPLQGSGLAGSLTWSFTPQDETTVVELTYSVGGFFEGGFASLAPGVDHVLGLQFERFVAFAETGRTERDVAGDADPAP